MLLLCSCTTLHVECLVTKLCTAFPFAGRAAETLTEADGSQQTQAALRREAGGEQRLQHVVGKGQRNHGLVGRVDHQNGNPETQEPAGMQSGGRGGHGGRHSYNCGLMGDAAGRPHHTRVGGLVRRKRITKVRGSRSTSFHFLISKHPLFLLVGMQTHMHKKQQI